MCQAVVLLFDVTKQQSFADAQIWLKSILQLAQRTPQLFLVANKIDDTKNRVVSRRLALEFAKRNALHFHEVSGKTGKGVKDLMDKITLYVLEKQGISLPAPKAETIAPPKACVGCTIV